jgi:CBS-domain-containing membrane protein
MRRAVRDVMTSAVVVVRDAAPFKEVVRRMQEHRVSALPVVDGEEHLVGIVSEGDLILKEDPAPEGEGQLLEGRHRWMDRQKAAGFMASQLMTTRVVTIGPDASLGDAAGLMHRNTVKRLVVTDLGGRILGVVSRADLLKVFLRDDLEIAHEIAEDIVRRTLWIDPATIRVVVKEGVVGLGGQVERRSLIRVLVGLVEAVEGVVGVDEHLSFLTDDTPPFAEPLTATAPARDPRPVS